MDLSRLREQARANGPVPGQAPGQLQKDALKLSADKTIYDIRTVLMWAEQSDRLDEKLMHVTHALELLDQVRENLEAMR